MEGLATCKEPTAIRPTARKPTSKGGQDQTHGTTSRSGVVAAEMHARTAGWGSLLSRGLDTSRCDWSGTPVVP